MDASRGRGSPLAARTRDGGGPSGCPEPRAPPLAPSPLGKSVRHLSPRKFHQLQQQQRAAVLRAMPLSPLSGRSESEPTSPREQQRTSAPRVFESREPVPWNPAWLSGASTSTRSDAKAVETLLRAAGALGASSSTRVGTTTLDAWLQSYEQEFLAYESLEHFVQVKLPEALAFCDKLAQQSRHQAESGGSGASETPNTRQQHLPTSQFHVRLRIAVFAHLVERTVFALAQSAALSRAKKPLFQARQEIFRAMFADYDKRTPGDSDSEREPAGHRARQRRRRRRRGSNDSQPSNGGSDDDDGRANSHDSNGSGSDDDGSDGSSDSADSDDDADSPNGSGARRPNASRSQRATSKARSSAYTSALYGPTAAPRTLAFFVAKVPFALKLREDTQRRTLRFRRNQAVLRRIVQALFRSLGSVFHAWKLHVRQKKEERLNTKGAQLTAMVVQQRGLVRSVFVEWSKATLRSRVHEMRSSELERRQQHEQVIADLRKEIFLLRERNRELQLELAETQRNTPVSRKLRSPALADTVEVTENGDGDSEATPSALRKEDKSVGAAVAVERLETKREASGDTVV